jgi:hypothetical protein
LPFPISISIDVTGLLSNRPEQARRSPRSASSVGLDDTLCYTLQIAVMLTRLLAAVKPSGVPPSRSLDYPQQRQYYDHDQYDQQHVDHRV